VSNKQNTWKKKQQQGETDIDTKEITTNETTALMDNDNEKLLTYLRQHNITLDNVQKTAIMK